MSGFVVSPDETVFAVLRGLGTPNPVLSALSTVLLLAGWVGTFQRVLTAGRALCGRIREANELSPENDTRRLVLTGTVGLFQASVLVLSLSLSRVVLAGFRQLFGRGSAADVAVLAAVAERPRVLDLFSFDFLGILLAPSDVTVAFVQIISIGSLLFSYRIGWNPLLAFAVAGPAGVFGIVALPGLVFSVALLLFSLLAEVLAAVSTGTPLDLDSTARFVAPVSVCGLGAAVLVGSMVAVSAAGMLRQVWAADGASFPVYEADRL